MVVDFTVSFCLLNTKAAMEHCAIQREEKEGTSVVLRAGIQLLCCENMDETKQHTYAQVNTAQKYLLSLNLKKSFATIICLQWWELLPKISFILSAEYLSTL